MEMLYDLLRAIHVISFVFMSIPLFNLIVASERGHFGPDFNYSVDNYMENILRGGAIRCFVFQASVGITGILLIFLGPLGIEALWTNWIIALKTVLLFTLIILLSRVHLKIQPDIDSLMARIEPETPPSMDITDALKPLRILRKKLASFCLFIVLTIIIFGLQVYSPFSPLLTGSLLILAALFSRMAYTKGIPFGWM